MNYQEVIERFERGYLVDSNGDTTQKDFEALKIAISAMQELDGYKKKLREVYGECEGLLENLIDGHVKYQKKLETKTPFKSRLLTDEDADLWEEYKKLGTIEEVREAMKEFQIIKSADGDLESCISELEQAKYDIETYWEEPTKLSKATGMAIKALIENQEYKQLCTLEEVLEAVEKQRPKKPKGDLNSVPHYRCPNCNGTVKLYSDSDKDKVCRWCGQAIDWDDEK